jgi:hypothetical protein
LELKKTAIHTRISTTTAATTTSLLMNQCAAKPLNILEDMSKTFVLMILVCFYLLGLTF